MKYETLLFFDHTKIVLKIANHNSSASLGMKQDRPFMQFIGATKPLSGPTPPEEDIHQQIVLASSKKSQGLSPPSIMPYGFRARRDLQMVELLGLFCPIST